MRGFREGKQGWIGDELGTLDVATCTNRLRGTSTRTHGWSCGARRRRNRAETGERGYYAGENRERAGRPEAHRGVGRRRGEREEEDAGSGKHGSAQVEDEADDGEQTQTGKKMSGGRRRAWLLLQVLGDAHDDGEDDHLHGVDDCLELGRNLELKLPCSWRIYSEENEERRRSEGGKWN